MRKRVITSLTTCSNGASSKVRALMRREGKPLSASEDVSLL